MKTRKINKKVATNKAKHVEVEDERKPNELLKKS